MRQPACWTILIVALVLAPGLAAPLAAQESTEDENGWNFTVAPYLLFPNMNGLTAIGELEADVDLDTGDIFKRLDFGRCSTSRWPTAIGRSGSTAST
jgi:hypothetical protein